MERELIAERTRSALAHKHENGQPTSHPPLGFTTNGSRHRVVPVLKGLEAVRQILDLWRRGLGVYALTDRVRLARAPSLPLI